MNELPPCLLEDILVIFVVVVIVFGDVATQSANHDHGDDSRKEEDDDHRVHYRKPMDLIENWDGNFVLVVLVLLHIVIGVLSDKPDWPLRKKVKIENDHKNMIDISNESTLNYIYDIILRYG